MKTSRGGKRSAEITNVGTKRQVGKRATQSGRNYVTYEFYDPVLGPRTFSGPRRRVMNEAKRIGYTESDLVRTERGK